MSLRKVKQRVQTASIQRNCNKAQNKLNNLLKFDIMIPSSSLNLQNKCLMFSKSINLKTHPIQISKDLYQSQKLKVYQNNSKASSIIAYSQNSTYKFKSTTSSKKREYFNNNFQQIFHEHKQDAFFTVFKKQLKKDNKDFEIQYQFANTQVQDSCKIKELHLQKAKISYKNIGPIISYGANSHKKEISIFEDKESRICTVLNLWKIMKQQYSFSNIFKKNQKGKILSFFGIYQTKQKGPYIDFITQKFHKMLANNENFLKIIENENLSIDLQETKKVLINLVQMISVKIQQVFLSQLRLKKMQSTFLLSGNFDFSIALISQNKVYLIKKGNGRNIISINNGQNFKISHNFEEKQFQQQSDFFSTLKNSQSKILSNTWFENKIINQQQSKQFNNNKFNSLRKYTQEGQQTMKKKIQISKSLKIDNKKISIQLNKIFYKKPINKSSNYSLKPLVKIQITSFKQHSIDFIVLGNQGLSFSDLSDQKIKNIIWKNFISKSYESNINNTKKKLENTVDNFTNLISSSRLSLNGNSLKNINTKTTQINNFINLNNNQIHDWTGQSVDKLLQQALSSKKTNNVQSILITFKNVQQCLKMGNQLTNNLNLPHLLKNCQ